jgi:hypothetical protein
VKSNGEIDGENVQHSREGPGERRLRNEQRGQAYGNYGNGISVERRPEQLYLLAARSEREQGEQGAGEDIGAVHKDALGGGQQEEERVVAGAVPAQVSEANCDGFWGEGSLRPESERASQNYNFVAQALISQVTGQQQTQLLDLTHERARVLGGGDAQQLHVVGD